MVSLHMLFMGDLRLLESVFNISTPLLLVNSPENEIHLFQGPAFGFLEEDHHENAHGSAENAKHEEGPPPNLVYVMRSDLGDDKVEQPLCGCSKANTIGAKTSGEYLKETSLARRKKL